MSRYFLHLHECGTVFEDVEGAVFADMAAACGAATDAARDVMSHEVREGRLCLTCAIEVVDAETGERTAIPFREAIAVTGL